MTEQKNRATTARAERLRAALRENLKRRKVQAKGTQKQRQPRRRIDVDAAMAFGFPQFRRICARQAKGLTNSRGRAARHGAGARGASRWIVSASSAASRCIGTIPISGAKNATLPLMIASLLTKDTLVLDNVPRLADVITLQRILANHGVDIMLSGKRPGDTEYQGQSLHISAARIVDTTAPYDLVSKMRASFWVIAPLLARMGEAKVSLPGGCAIGTRPVDLLIMALERLGAKVEIDAGYVIANAPGGLKGGEIAFPKVTVGGTHTALMAASLAHGTTVIENAAREPEIADVADCLNKMGAKISGAGTSRIIIDGVTRLSGARHSVLPDRIETGTYAMAVAMTGGDIMLAGARPELLQSALDVLTQAGVQVTVDQRRHSRRAQWRGPLAGRRDDRAVPGLSDRSAGATDGADDARQRHLAHRREDFRKPLHARAGTGAVRRAHSARRRHRA